MRLKPLHARMWWLVPVVAVALPLLCLWPLDGVFATDWVNHEWLSAYAGHYLQQRASLPVVINTAAEAGMPYPVFYGSLFYPVLSLGTAVLRAGVVIRAFVLVVTWLEWRLIVRALVRMELEVWRARGIACLVIWATYPLTNLYNRSAITEYVATGLLVCMLALWFLLVHARDAAERTRLGLGFGLAFALCAGTHPITALYSLPVLAMFVVAAYVERGRDRAFWLGLVKALAIPAAASVVALAPWVYVLSKFQPYLEVGRDKSVWFYHGIDRLSTRLWPIPMDPRTHGHAIEGVPTPYLDAQIALPIAIVLVGWLAVLARRDRGAGLRATVLGVAAFAVFLWLSLARSAYDVLPGFARLIQIAYRAVAYQNLSLLLAVFMLVGALRRRHQLAVLGRRAGTAVLAVAVTLGVVGIVVKWVHASAIRSERAGGLLVPRSERHATAVQPPEFYGYFNYATRDLYQPLGADASPRHAALLPDVGAKFGETRPLRVEELQPRWITTNVQAFPWNRLYLDGARVPDDELRADWIHLAVRVPAGAHTIELRTVPDGTWLWLRRLSFAVLALWAAALAWLSVRAYRSRTA